MTRAHHVRRLNLNKFTYFVDNKSFHGQGLETVTDYDGECVKGKKVKYQ
jgi:hypothetical protein